MLTTLMLGTAALSTAWCDGDFQWQGQLKPGQLLEIRGIHGAIIAQGGADSTASVTAHKTGGISDPSTVSIAVTPYDGGVVICTMYPDADADHPNTCNPPGMDSYLSANNNDVQIDFTAVVPLGVNFGAHGNKGDIQAASLTADVNATTIDGNIGFSTSGTGQANTLNGSITASIGSVNWTGARHYDAMNGDVDVSIPADANVSVQASAFRGGIQSDFPLMIMPTFFGRSSMASGTLGSGGRSLKLSSFTGNITLRQGPASGKQTE
jgi:hypothetical protein